MAVVPPQLAQLPTRLDRLRRPFCDRRPEVAAATPLPAPGHATVLLARAEVPLACGRDQCSWRGPSAWRRRSAPPSDSPDPGPSAADTDRGSDYSAWPGSA